MSSQHVESNLDPITPQAKRPNRFVNAGKPAKLAEVKAVDEKRKDLVAQLQPIDFSKSTLLTVELNAHVSYREIVGPSVNIGRTRVPQTDQGTSAPEPSPSSKPSRLGSQAPQGAQGAGAGHPAGAGPGAGKYCSPFGRDAQSRAFGAAAQSTAKSKLAPKASKKLYVSSAGEASRTYFGWHAFDGMLWMPSDLHAAAWRSADTTCANASMHYQCAISRHSLFHAWSLPQHPCSPGQLLDLPYLPLG